MTSPNRSVVVRLAMEPSSYIAGASRAAASTAALNAEVSKVGGATATSMERAAKSAGAAEGALGKLNKSAGALGFTLGGLAGVGGGIAAALSVKWAGDYQAALTKLATTAGESQKNLGRVGQGMLDMAGQVGIGADELAKGMYTVESSGIHGANALVVLKAAAQGAKQENADLSKVTDAVTTALHDYNLPASDAAKVTSQLVTAVSHGKTTFDELTGAMHSVTPLAAALHVPLSDIAGTLSAMTASGESADQAAQNMADALRHLQSPTSTMTAELGQLGINSAELGPMLGQKGLAGTIQYISSAIVDHLDPATKQVLLPALNQSKNAAQDLQIMLGQMPPTLAKLASGLMDGSVSLKDYRTKVKDLGGTAEVMGTQFLGLFQSSQGFSNILKSGSPAAQEYTAALQKAMGTSAGLTVALQVTGEHAAATNDAIKDIARSAGDAQGNIKGWDEVQGNFNQQLSQAEAHLKSMAIEAGQHLLPALTGAFGFVNRDVLPALEGMGSAVGDAVHWWSQLPTPIKDVSLALGGLALSNMIGLTGALSSGVARIGATFTSTGAQAAASGIQLGGFSDEMALQQRLFQMEEAGLGGVDAAFVSASAAADTYAASLTNVQRMQMGWDASLAESALMEDAQVASLGRMSAAMATVQARGMGTLTAGMNGLKSAGSGVMSMLGGPWGLALAGAVVDVMLITNAEQKATEQEQKWTDALKQGGKAADEASAAMAKNAAQVDAIHRGFMGFGTSIASAIAPVDAMIPKARDAQKAFDDWYHSLTGVDKASEDVRLAAARLSEQIDRYGPSSAQAQTASENYQGALARQKTAQDQLNGAEQTHLQHLQDIAQKELDSVSSSLAAQQAHLSFDSALQQLNADTAISTQKTDEGRAAAARLNQEQLGLAQTAIGWAQSAGAAAAAQAKANGVTDTASASNKAQLDVLQQVATQMGDKTPASIRQAIAALQNATVNTASVTDAVSKMGLTTGTESDRFRREWGNNAVVLKNVTDAQVKDLQGLGYTVTTLPNHQILVSADTKTARNAITQLTNDYAQYSINVGLKIGTSAFARAGGGPVWGPGSTTSDSIPAMLSNREWVIKAASAEKYGPHAMAAVNAGTATVIPHLAGGGPVTLDDMYLNAKVGISPASLTAAGQSIKSQLSSFTSAAAVGGAGGAARWSGVVLQALAMMGQPASLLGVVLRRMNQESGGNPNAINLWDSNAKAGYPSQGLMQTIPSTFAAYHYPGTSYNIDDPLANVLASMRYALARYGSLAAAYNRMGGYKDGTDYVPSTGPAVLHQGEAVLTTEQAEAYRAGVRSREVSGGSTGSGAELVAALREALGGAGVRDFVGLAVYGDVHTDPDELARRAERRARRLLSAAGIGS